MRARGIDIGASIMDTAKDAGVVRPLIPPWLALMGLMVMYMNPLTPEHAELLALGLPVERWYRSLVWLLALYSGWHVLLWVLSALLRGSALTSSTLDDELIGVLGRHTLNARGPQRVFVYAAMVYVSSKPLGLPLAVTDRLGVVVNALVGLWLVDTLWELLYTALKHMLTPTPVAGTRDARVEENKPLVALLDSFVRPLFYLAGALAIADNCGIEVGPLVASLSLGGLVVAMSTKLVLEDLTAGLTLLLDRPFHVGDCISVGGGPSGSVVHVGIKSTELQCANGDRLVVCNKDVANAKINKFLPTADRSRVLTFPLSPKVVGAAAVAISQGLAEEIVKALDEGEGGLEGRGQVVMDSVLLSDVLAWGGVAVEVRYKVKECSAAQGRRAAHDVIVATMKVLGDKGLTVVTNNASNN